MGVNLVKGQRSDLTKGNPNLSKIFVGLGWDVRQYDGGTNFDLDAEAFMLDVTGKVCNDDDFIFYNKLAHPSGALLHTGDNRTGAGEGDDEVIHVDLKKIPAHIEKIAFTVTIHEAEKYKLNFGQVSNAFVRIVDEVTGEELLRYDLGEDFSIETAIVVGEIYRHQGEWKFNAIGSGFKGGLRALCFNYGVSINEY